MKRQDENDSSKLNLEIAGTDLALARQGGFWTDKLDIFLIERDDAVLHANLSSRTLVPATYQKILKEGLYIES